METRGQNVDVRYHRKGMKTDNSNAASKSFKEGGKERVRPWCKWGSGERKVKRLDPANKELSLQKRELLMSSAGHEFEKQDIKDLHRKIIWQN